MTRIISTAIGSLLVLAGILFTLQGLDVIGGAAMSGKTLWVVLGPIIALVGLVLILRGGRARSAGRDLD